MPSKKVNKLAKSITSVFKGKEEPEIIREDVTADMRKNGAIIISILSSTDIERSKLSDEIKEAGRDEYGACDEEIHRLNLIEELQNAPAISDDMRQIDRYMVKFAQCYREAAEQGQNTAFHWCGNALARGISLRQNLRHEDEEYRRNDMNYRLQQMEDFDNLIVACKALDEAMERDVQSVAQYHKHAAEFNELHNKIVDYIASPEGGAAQKELDENSRQTNGIWSDAARNLNSWYNDLARGEMAVIQSAIWMDENKETLASCQDMLQKFREALRQNSGIYGEKLTAEFMVLLDRQRKLLEDTQVRNTEIRQKMHDHTRSMQVIATESDQAKVREYWREETKQNLIERQLKMKHKEEVTTSDYSFLKQKEEQVHTQRITNSMD